MKNLIAAVLLLMCGSVQAAIVTIDFEEFDGAPTLSVFPPGSFEVEPWFLVSTTGNLFWFDDSCCTGNEDSYVQILFSVEVTVTHAQGNQFDLLSFDRLVGLVAPSAGSSFLLTGQKSDGSTVESWITGINTVSTDYETILLSSQFENLVSITFSDSSAAVQLDNITVNAVPIPAAVWLFGSGLGLLGWMKRKRA